MSLAYSMGDNHSSEWYRLSEIARKYEPRMRLAYTKAIKDGLQVDKLELRQVMTSIVAEVCRSTANQQRLIFNPNSPIYIDTIDRCVDHFAGIIDSTQAKDEVKRILPQGLTLMERRERLNTFGLDARSAVRVERIIQERGHLAAGRLEAHRARQDAIRVRGNSLATTETNRVVNSALEALWIDNLGDKVSKALPDDTTFYDKTTVRRISTLPKKARKEWLTRRDGKVCKYCDPLDGITARIGTDFDTDYGMFATPPIHPHCRCFIIVSTAR